jgi:RNA polymerase sigma-70 factor (ECF subfamily)
MSLMEAPSTVDLILAEADHLRMVGRRLTHCDADADDLAQEAMLRAYLARARFTAGTSVRAWTTTILRRIFLTEAALRRRRPTRTDTDAGGPLGGIAERDARAAAKAFGSFAELAEDLDDEVKRALGRVPTHYREALDLAVMQDMSCKEISRAVSLPPGTVMSRIHRARERMRAELAAYPGRPRARAAAIGRRPIGRDTYAPQAAVLRAAAARLDAS